MDSNRPFAKPNFSDFVGSRYIPIYIPWSVGPHVASRISDYDRTPIEKKGATQTSLVVLDEKQATLNWWIQPARYFGRTITKLRR